MLPLAPVTANVMLVGSGTGFIIADGWMRNGDQKIKDEKSGLTMTCCAGRRR